MTEDIPQINHLLQTKDYDDLSGAQKTNHWIAYILMTENSPLDNLHLLLHLHAPNQQSSPEGRESRGTQVLHVELNDAVSLPRKFSLNTQPPSCVRKGTGTHQCTDMYMHVWVYTLTWIREEQTLRCMHTSIHMCTHKKVGGRGGWGGGGGEETDKERERGSGGTDRQWQSERLRERASMSECERDTEGEREWQTDEWTARQTDRQTEIYNDGPHFPKIEILSHG